MSPSLISAYQSVRTDQTVVIQGDRIASVSDSAKSQLPKSPRALVIDAAGQYLIPGLWDMHVHSAFGDWFSGGQIALQEQDR
jgi:imidazolonepropionase-like amidohydrolase